MIKLINDSNIYNLVIDNISYDVIDGIVEVKEEHVNIAKSFNFIEIKEENLTEIKIKKGKK